MPIYPIAPDQEKSSLGVLLRSRKFWFVMLLMVCAGASEQGMSQWASAFAESALHLSKTAGDLAGPCCFALLMGAARAPYGKFSDRVPLEKAMTVCAVLCVGCYVLAVVAPHPVRLCAVRLLRGYFLARDVQHGSQSPSRRGNGHVQEQRNRERIK